MFIILGALLFLLVTIIAIYRTKRKLALSSSIIICMVIAGIGALIGAFFEMFLPMTTERLDDIKRTQAPCVVEALVNSNEQPTEMRLLKAMTACQEMKPKK